ncbi:manganese catalase family protein [Bacillus sp. L381]|uniref:manganese catalase family protein n=1 Tax=Bacillus TaxID=1386 RepID=UPI000E222740|nr:MULTISPECIES: manganese catalase family protein [Bacillus]MCR9040632.1 manganese catalase family protein [Bacillus velezensis]QUN10042.1 manganese catalase family protein [Bacillus amyloliquefaciens]QYM83115.1 manganese catalase family protein [Bacillus sp. 7D3]QZY12355.1 manganese catalase family protein [Bacillus amyloliquefaciens]RDY83663.1 manganese catalase [Bacillus amyloliquefaciens]
MFTHTKRLQHPAKPDRPDPLFAKKMQEILGGQYGEISVAMQYLFQGWNTRGNEKYKDLLMDTATEELGHVEMIATMIARLLEDAPLAEQEKAADDPVIGSILGGMNPHHAIVSGLGAMPESSTGVPWSAGYIVASGNLLADFRANLNAESQGRLQVARLYEMTDDKGVKDMLSFLLARDTMHQNQWLAAIKELEAQEGPIVPSTFPKALEKQSFSHKLIHFSDGGESAEQNWLQEKAPDGEPFEYEKEPKAHGEIAKLDPVPPYVHNTLPGRK